MNTAIGDSRPEVCALSLGNLDSEKKLTRRHGETEKKFEIIRYNFKIIPMYIRY